MKELQLYYIKRAVPDSPINFVRVLMQLQKVALETVVHQNSSSHRSYSVRKGVLRNFAKFTEKQLSKACNNCLRPATLLKETLAQVFSCEFCEISKNTFFTEHLWATASVKINILNPFQANILFLYPWKYHKTSGFMMFSGVRERQYWPGIG